MTAEWIAAYLDGGLSPQERGRIEEHLLVCAECRHDLAVASELTGHHRSRWVVRAAPLAAAAAALVILFLNIPDRSPTAGDSMLRGPGASSQVEVVSPQDGSSAERDSLTFTWHVAGPQAHYVFTLLDADGNVLFTNGAPDTTLVLPASVGLEADTPYFWFVDALLDRAESVSSGVQEFVLRP